MAWRATAALAALSLVAAGPTVHAADLEFYTGTALYAQCSARPGDADYQPREARCGAYVLGVSDAHQAAQGAGGAARVCLPPTASSVQLVDDVKAYLAAHPDKREVAAQDLVVEALAAAYPCR